MGHIPGRDDEPEHQGGAQPAAGVSDRTRYIIMAVFVGLLALVSWAVYATGEDDTGDDRDDWGAYNACTQFVERQLRAPATADFPPHRQADISRSVVRYTVRSHVDAENAFGATVRTDWTCEVSRTDDGWEGSATLLE